MFFFIARTTPQMTNLYFAFFFSIGKTQGFILDNPKLGANFYYIRIYWKIILIMCKGNTAEIFTCFPFSYIAISNSWCFDDSKTNSFLIFCLVEHTTISLGTKCNWITRYKWLESNWDWHFNNGINTSGEMVTWWLRTLRIYYNRWWLH